MKNPSVIDVRDVRDFLTVVSTDNISISQHVQFNGKQNNSTKNLDICDIPDIMATNHLTQFTERLVYYNNNHMDKRWFCHLGYCELTRYSPYNKSANKMDFGLSLVYDAGGSENRIIDITG